MLVQCNIVLFNNFFFCRLVMWITLVLSDCRWMTVCHPTEVDSSGLKGRLEFLHKHLKDVWQTEAVCKFARLVGPAGFEPATNRLWVSCSNRWATGPYKKHPDISVNFCLDKVVTSPTIRSAGGWLVTEVPSGSPLSLYQVMYVPLHVPWRELSFGSIWSECQGILADNLNLVS